MRDFVVVGAGPAGSRFARQAAAAGREVLVFERGAVGEPLACSGHVSLDVYDYVADDARDSLRQNEIRGARFRLGGPGSDDYRFYTEDPISNAIDRVGLDRHLASLARDAGARVREHHTVIDVAEAADRVTVTVRGPDGDLTTHEARMVVGADGPRSRVRRAVDVPDPEEFLHGVLGFDPDPDHEDNVDVHLTVPRFFAWRIPRGEAGVEYGLAAPPGTDVFAEFDRLIDEYGADVGRTCSGLIPIGPPDRVTGERSLLLGDAAGQTKPFTGGGIHYGMAAADHAARTVDPVAPGTLADYESAWRRDIGREIRLGHLIRRAYSLPRPVQRAGLRALSGKIGVDMDRPSSVFSLSHLRAWLSG